MSFVSTELGTLYRMYIKLGLLCLRLMTQQSQLNYYDCFHFNNSLVDAMKNLWNTFICKT